jgi:hypothetical protein
MGITDRRRSRSEEMKDDDKTFDSKRGRRLDHNKVVRINIAPEEEERRRRLVIRERRRRLVIKSTPAPSPATATRSSSLMECVSPFFLDGVSDQSSTITTPSSTSSTINQHTFDVDESSYDHLQVMTPPKQQTVDEFSEWVEHTFAYAAPIEERYLQQTNTDGKGFRCLMDSNSQLCFVKHGKIFRSILGWIESCSVARRDSNGRVEPFAFHGLERVAIKVFDLKKVYRSISQENCARELMIHSRITELGHDNILPLLQCYRTSNKIFAVFPYYEGGDLFEQLASLETRNVRLSESDARQIFRGAIDAVACCHQNGYAHRDISLENLLFPTNGTKGPILIDFGVSCAIDLSDGMVNHVGPVGKAKYMAPELFSKVASLPRYDPRKCDVFSLGVSLLILITRMEPWESTSTADVRFQQMVVHKQLNMILRIWGIILSDPLMDLIMSMLNVNPVERLNVQQVRDHPWMRNIA